MSETIISKRCSHCKPIKPISNFTKDRLSKDGLAYRCKACQRIDRMRYLKTEKGKAAQKRYRQSDKGRAAELKRVKKYRKTEKGRKTYLKAQRKFGKSEKGKAYQKQWCLNHPESRKAKAAVNWLVRIGKLPRPDTLPCHYCPKQAKEYHHWHGYEPEHRLDIVPVCKKCHSEHPYYPALSKPAGSKKGIMA